MALDIKQVEFDVCSREWFQQRNAEWHSTLPKIGAINTMKICFAAWAGNECIAVAAWSNPTARLLPQQTWLELRRFAISEAAPRNTATKMLAWMRRQIEQRFPEIVQLISYQSCEDHRGTIYKAANWTPQETLVPGAWNNRKRWNRTAESIRTKIRWILPLRRRRNRSPEQQLLFAG